MDVTVTDAEGRWDELIRRAQHGEEIVLTRDGQSVAKLGPVAQTQGPEGAAPARGSAEWRARIDEITRRAVAEALPSDGPASDHSFLYDEYGLPK